MGEEGHVGKTEVRYNKKGSRSKWSEREMKKLGGKRAERETEREREKIEVDTETQRFVDESKGSGRKHGGLRKKHNVLCKVKSM